MKKYLLATLLFSLSALVGAGAERLAPELKRDARYIDAMSQEAVLIKAGGSWLLEQAKTSERAPPGPNTPSIRSPHYHCTRVRRG